MGVLEDDGDELDLYDTELMRGMWEFWKMMEMN